MSRRRNRPQAEKSRILAGILAVFFGTFGAHRFYLRDPGVGFLYLFIFFMTSRLFFFPITMVMGWIEAFRLFTMSESEFDRKYNKHLSQEDNLQRERRRPSRRQNRGLPPQRQGRRSRQPVPAAPRAIQKSNPFKKSGIKKYKEYDYEGAIEDFQQGFEKMASGQSGKVVLDWT